MGSRVYALPIFGDDSKSLNFRAGLDISSIASSSGCVCTLCGREGLRRTTRGETRIFFSGGILLFS